MTKIVNNYNKLDEMKFTMLYELKKFLNLIQIYKNTYINKHSETINTIRIK